VIRLADGELAPEAVAPDTLTKAAE
jgi:hypothetical protein